ncbi:MAG: S9 family peptidase [Deltaproteobacteria bacterium]|nr:S9 family peptidase [Deltaproteobacteria bacterium]
MDRLVLVAGVAALVLAAACSTSSPSRPVTAGVHPAAPSASVGPHAGTRAVAPVPAGEVFSRPPRAPREDIRETLHGIVIHDPYRALEDATSPATRSWLAAFDGYTRRHLATLPGRDALAVRLTELNYIEWVSAPRRHGKRYFWAQQHRDKEKAVWYWREGKTGAPIVLLDPNTLSKDGSVALLGVFPSKDGKKVAYKLSANNKDEATLQVMDVATTTPSVIDTIPGAKYAAPSWEPKGKGFYYSRLPVDPSIPVDRLPGEAAVHFHVLGTHPVNDAIVREKTGDPSTFVGAEVSRDGRYLVASVHHGWTRTDLHYRELGKHREFQPLVVGEQAHFDEVVHGGKFYIRTDLGAPRYRVMIVDPSKKTDLASWKELVPEDPKAVLESMAVVGGRLALKYLENASSKLAIHRLDGKLLWRVETPSIGTLGALVGNPEDDEAYYTYESFLEPQNVFETSVSRGGRKPFFEVKVPVDPSPYVVEQVVVRSKDGTPVTMFVVRRRDMKKDGSTPFLLNGYGGFKIAKVPAFSATLFAWLERGGGFALPNLRGGGEYGEDWHRAGMLEQKQNVFDDFIAAAEWLQANGYTSRERLAISGGSNGGLLVGAAMTQRPELFRAVVCSVPLLDMVRYHRFGSGRTWISEYGSAEDPAQFRALHAYSPYHRIRQGVAYPSLLMMTADSDDRVDPLHARKFAAALLDAKGNDANVLVRVETNAGHAGGDMLKKNVERGTDLYAFLFEELGMNR